jgi:hypothetical protein
MDELFAIDERARKENLNPSDRHLLRLEKTKPLLEQIKAAIQAARSDALPKSETRRGNQLFFHSTDESAPSPGSPVWRLDL